MRVARHVKVLVLGPGEAGKSTLIAALCGNAINLEVQGRTVALDHGTLEDNGTTFHFFGVPGQARFAPVQESLLSGTQIGVVVRRAGEDLDAPTRTWCARLKNQGVPLVLLINRFASSEAGAAGAGNDPVFAEEIQLHLDVKAEAATILPVLHRLVRKEE